MKKPSGYWTKERVFEEARKYQTRSEFNKCARRPYIVSLKNGWLDEMDWFEEVKRPNGYWTKERVFEEARKYQTRSEFDKCCRGAYKAALSGGWLDEMRWFKNGKKKKHFWTKDMVFEEARKYQTRSEFGKCCRGAYKAALSGGWLDEMRWFKELCKPNGYWTRETVFEEARKYKTKNTFKKGNRRAYELARRSGWLDEMHWLIDGRLKLFTDKIDCVYRYFFTETNFIYVGRTVNVKRRNDEHRTKKRDIVFRYANENGLEIPKMEIIEDKLTLEEGQEREDYWKEYYVHNGYNVLNKAKTGKGIGSLGAINFGKWTKDRVFEEARKYQTRSEFGKCCRGAYQAAWKNGWLDEMRWFKELCKPNGYWTRETAFEEARKYGSRSEFSKRCRRAYELARRSGWLDEMDWFEEVRKPKGYWTRETVFEESRKYGSRTEFSKRCGRAYDIALRNGWLDEMDWLKEACKPNGYWTKERVFEESRKYQTRVKFQKSCGSAYNIARKNRWLDEMFPKNKMQS